MLELHKAGKGWSGVFSTLNSEGASGDRVTKSTTLVGTRPVRDHRRSSGTRRLEYTHG